MALNGQESPPTAPGTRFVLLGASNVSRGLSVIVPTARRLWGPLEMFVAPGHGRSYGRGSRVLHRELPGIVECGLWSALAARPRLPTRALLTDIGNDLLYEYPVEEIIGWVGACLARLTAVGATIAMTRLPLANFEGLGPWRFRAARKIFFPACRLDLDSVHGRAHELDARLAELAAEYSVTLLEQRRAWFGLDPIHITYRQLGSAWRALLDHERRAANAPRSARWSPAGMLRFSAVFPERRKVFGAERRARQPTARFGDGTTLWLY